MSLQSLSHVTKRTSPQTKNFQFAEADHVLTEKLEKDLMEINTVRPSECVTTANRVSATSWDQRDTQSEFLRAAM
ncbi:ATV_HP_G0103610.mRNA.1.CDS.1 [Saccharomyces cerevisiae]|nr:ATV_HP_G0103610.mRNA.1.CDS.1 [Saccharomyces cerevisiae]CAI6619277.1 ATV_HP_G0103610.mRNA.1.CDS.1 [Saccharomyces cerevisiae]